jgi:hypothetical protein
VERLLASRGGSAAREYRIKYRDRSYLHTEWVKLAELEEAAALFPGLRSRLKHFEARRAKDMQRGLQQVRLRGKRPRWRWPRLDGSRTCLCGACRASRWRSAAAAAAQARVQRAVRLLALSDKHCGIRRQMTSWWMV